VLVDETDATDEGEAQNKKSEDIQRGPHLRDDHVGVYSVFGTLCNVYQRYAHALKSRHGKMEMTKQRLRTHSGRVSYEQRGAPTPTLRTWYSLSA
jgi:hypothetical protein